MPCFDPFAEAESAAQDAREHAMVEAILCGVLTALERVGIYRSVFDSVEWGEAGVSHEAAVKWFMEHKRKDKARQARENKEARADDARRTAMAKLTAAEKSALGIFK